ncbi:MAG: sugar ABC transporter substrate-binding protein [Clostridiaceae bacterium]|nr:sugar ABC transporter substrate-binding protein [Clostridiaceae bacterium]
MKKTFAIVLALVLCLTALMAGCGKTEQPATTPGNSEPATSQQPAQSGSQKIKIGVSISNFDDTFLMYMKDGMDEYAKSLGGEVEVTYVDAKEDSAKQLAQVENFISQGVSAIVVVPVNTEATEPITNACQSAKIPLVYVNRLPGNLPDDVVFVGSESIDAGIFQMEYIAEKLGGKGNVVIMVGKLDNEAAIKRTEGVKQVAAKYPDINIIFEQTANWSREEGMSLMENWLSTGKQIDAVASNNDDMALGALKAIEAAGKLGQIIVGGVDATPDALAEMEAGRLDCTVFQDAGGQGSGAIKAAVALAKGEKVENRVWIPFQLVTPDNYKEFKK